MEVWYEKMEYLLFDFIVICGYIGEKDYMGQRSGVLEECMCGSLLSWGDHGSLDMTCVRNVQIEFSKNFQEFFKTRVVDISMSIGVSPMILEALVKNIVYNFSRGITPFT